MAFTKEQQLAIDKEGANIIVSAGAGSGKTAVLTERVLRKLKAGIDINHLLILTFTNEAASEMKSRIRDGIIKNNVHQPLKNTSISNRFKALPAQITPSAISTIPHIILFMFFIPYLLKCIIS